jgi:hypothetical protein
MNNVIEGLNTRFHVALESNTDREFYEALYYYFDYFHKTPELKAIFDKSQHEYSEQHYNLWKNRPMTEEQADEAEAQTFNSEERKITFEQLKKLLLQRNYKARVFKKAEPVAQREYAGIVLSNVPVRDQKSQHPRFKPAYQVLADLPKNATIAELCTTQHSNKLK